MYKRTHNDHIQKLVLSGMFAAVLAVISQLQIPMPSGMPLTLQTYAVALIGFVLGSRYGVASVAIYILLGAVGLPVFTGFGGGFGKLFGVTGGFIWGFLVLAAACGFSGRAVYGGAPVSVNIIWKKLQQIMVPLAGLFILHLLGSVQFSLVMQMELREAVLLASAPYWVKDILSVLAAFITMKAIRRRLNAVIHFE